MDPEQRREQASQDRWQGQVDERLDRSGTNQDVLAAELREMRSLLRDMSIELAVLKTRVAVYSTAGSIGGAALASFLFQQIGG